MSVVVDSKSIDTVEIRRFSITRLKHAAVCRQRGTGHLLKLEDSRLRD